MPKRQPSLLLHHRVDTAPIACHLLVDLSTYLPEIRTPNSRLPCAATPNSRRAICSTLTRPAHQDASSVPDPSFFVEDEPAPAEPPARASEKATTSNSVIRTAFGGQRDRMIHGGSALPRRPTNPLVYDSQQHAQIQGDPLHCCLELYAR